MYKDKSGYYISDFRLYKIRYQQKWNTKNKKEAQKWEDEYKESLKKQHFTNANLGKFSLKAKLGFTEPYSDISLEEVKEYIIDKWQNKSDVKNSISRLNTAIEFFKNKPVTHFTNEDIKAYKDFLLSQNKATATVNNYLFLLQSVLNYLEETQRVLFKAKPNILKYIEKTNLQAIRRDIIYSSEDERAIYKYLEQVYQDHQKLEDKEYYIFIKLLFKLGFRPSEFTELTFNDINLLQEQVTISKGANIGQNTKNNLTRTLPLDELSKDCFIELMTLAMGRLHLPQELQKEFRNSKNSEVLPLRFRQMKIFSLSKIQCEYRWQKVKKALNWIGKGFKDYNQYQIRHTVATRLVTKHNFNTHQLKAYLGHKAISTSLNYIHLNTQDLKLALQR